MKSEMMLHHCMMLQSVAPFDELFCALLRINVYTNKYNHHKYNSNVTSGALLSATSNGPSCLSFCRSLTNSLGTASGVLTGAPLIAPSSGPSTATLNASLSSPFCPF